SRRLGAPAQAWPGEQDGRGREDAADVGAGVPVVAGSVSAPLPEPAEATLKVLRCLYSLGHLATAPGGGCRRAARLTAPKSPARSRIGRGMDLGGPTAPRPADGMIARLGNLVIRPLAR